MQYVIEGVLGIALLAVVAAIVTVTIISGASELTQTRLPDLAFALAGGLAGVTTSKAISK
jgi:hypothetical protein